MAVPTWLYSKDGQAVIAKTEDEVNDLLNKGWKDSPDRFKEEVKEPSKPQNFNSNKGRKR